MQNVESALNTLSQAINITHQFADLDNLCALYLLRKKIPDLKFEFRKVEFPLKKEKGYYYIDIPGGDIDHHSIPGLWSSCKLILRMLLNIDATFEKYVNIVDYCTRADKGQLQSFEKCQGSLIHTIYALRSQEVPDLELLNIFTYIADKASENSLYLTNMCEVLLSQYNPKLADILAKETLSFTEILRKYIRFVDLGDNKWIALNNSNFNVTKKIFDQYNNVIIIIFSSQKGRAGIISRNKNYKFDFNKLQKDLGKQWYVSRDGLSLVTKTLKGGDKIELSCEELLGKLLKYWYS